MSAVSSDDSGPATPTLHPAPVIRPLTHGSMTGLRWREDTPSGAPSAHSEAVGAPRFGDVDCFYSIDFAAADGPHGSFGPSRLLELRGDHDATRPRPGALRLTVTRPANTRRDLPVVVWVHGGSYVRGDHNKEDVSGLARQCVVVSVGYRLGLEGFFPFADPPAEKPHHYRGIDDVNCALEWVQNHIEDFGGDPTNVSLVGQSAGGGIVLWLARKDHYRGGFRRILSLSPAFPRVPLSQRESRLRPLGVRTLDRTTVPRISQEQLDRFLRKHADVPLGPFPLQVDELVDIPLVLGTTTGELANDDGISRLDRRGLGRIATRLCARKVFHVNSPASYLQHLEKGEEFAQTSSDAIIRRWVSDIAEQAESPTWLVTFEGVYHSGEKAALFSGHHPLVPFLLGHDPAWPTFRPERTSLRITPEGTDGGLHTDPLRRARLYYQEL